MKLLIEWEEGISESDAVMAAWRVVNQGRISNYGKEFCYVTKFHNGLVVWSKKNKCSDKLYVSREAV